MRMVQPQETQTPNPIPEGYDWRKESWVDESNVTDLDYTTAFALAAALSAMPNEDNPYASEPKTHSAATPAGWTMPTRQWITPSDPSR